MKGSGRNVREEKLRGLRLLAQGLLKTSVLSGVSRSVVGVEAVFVFLRTVEKKRPQNGAAEDCKRFKRNQNNTWLCLQSSRADMTEDTGRQVPEELTKCEMSAFAVIRKEPLQ